jgi:hypothetical protein
MKAGKQLGYGIIKAHSSHCIMIYFIAINAIVISTTVSVSQLMQM